MRFLLQVGSFAVLVRQNNIIWVALAAATAFLQDVELNGAWPQQRGRVSVVQLVGIMLRRLAAVWVAFLPVVLLGVAFAAFVWRNGGVVLGDKTAHVPVFHFAQAMYLAAIVGAYCVLDVALAAWSSCCRRDGKAASATDAAWLHAIAGTGTAADATPVATPTPVDDAGGSTVSAAPRCTAAGTLRSLAAFTVATAVVAWAVQRWTFVHLYLLSDNRHYTFYWWARLWGPKPWLRVAAAPVYVGLAGVALTRLVAAHGGRWEVGALRAAAWAVCAAAAVIPSRLVEPRYFVTPVVLFLLHVRWPRMLPVAAIVAVHALVCAATLWVFVTRPFTAPDGSVGRFIW